MTKEDRTECLSFAPFFIGLATLTALAGCPGSTDTSPPGSETMYPVGDATTTRQDSAQDSATGRQDTTNGTNTFTLQVTLHHAIDCQADDPKRDCVGMLYWGLYDEYPAPQLTPLVSGNTAQSADGTILRLNDLPVGDVRYFGAFIDDNDSYGSFAAPDTGDPVAASEKFSASGGETKSLSVSFSARTP